MLRITKLRAQEPSAKFSLNSIDALGRVATAVVHATLDKVVHLSSLDVRAHQAAASSTWQSPQDDTGTRTGTGNELAWVRGGGEPQVQAKPPSDHMEHAIDMLG